MLLAVIICCQLLTFEGQPRLVEWEIRRHTDIVACSETMTPYSEMNYWSRNSTAKASGLVLRDDATPSAGV